VRMCLMVLKEKNLAPGFQLRGISERKLYDY
jgi:hypothetical protein